MKALILNSGLGHRMGVLTSEHPKCMTDISEEDTILSNQLKLIAKLGIEEVVITTGYCDNILVNYCKSLKLPLDYNFIKNPIYDKTNYIYSIYCAKKELKDQDILLMHGDLVFTEDVLTDILAFAKSCMKVSSTIPLPDKDFKAVVKDGLVKSVGIEFFDSAMEAQALYKLNKAEWNKWLDKIIEFCEIGMTNCYAEAALNEITDDCLIYAFDAKNRLCTEIDTPDDLKKVKEIISHYE